MLVCDKQKPPNECNMNSNHTTLFYNFMHFFCDDGVRFHDIRATVTFVGAVLGFILSECVHLNLWVRFRRGEAKVASKERQFFRWLHNDCIDPMIWNPVNWEILNLCLTFSWSWQRQHCIWLVREPLSLRWGNVVWLIPTSFAD